MDASLQLRRWTAIAIALSILPLAGCATLHVSSFAERGFDFGGYKTYDWAADDRFETGDPRLDNNTFFEDRLRADVERQLGARGLEKTLGGAPALLVHYHATINQKIDVARVDQKYGYCDECVSSVYDAGTIVIDFVDAQTNKLVWRGWAEGSLDGAIDNQDWMEQEIDTAVVRILQTLPQHL